MHCRPTISCAILAAIVISMPVSHANASAVASKADLSQDASVQNIALLHEVVLKHYIEETIPYRERLANWDYSTFLVGLGGDWNSPTSSVVLSRPDRDFNAVFMHQLIEMVHVPKKDSIKAINLNRRAQDGIEIEIFRTTGLGNGTATVEIITSMPSNSEGEEPIDEDTVSCAFKDGAWHIVNINTVISLP